MNSPDGIFLTGLMLLAFLLAVAAALWLRRGRKAAASRQGAVQARSSLPQASPAGDEIARLQAEIESLQDELWELKSRPNAAGPAAAAGDSKTRFLATISHEMRTPLNGILGMVELMREDNLTAEQTNYLDAIRTSATALATLIEEVLDFAKIEAGKLELTEESFDPAALVEGVVELLAPRAQGKGIEIAARTAVQVPARLMGDPARLRQVLINLAGNAVKFTSRGGVGLRVDMTQGGRVRFAIADTGPGIAAERQGAIFEDFEQADGSATRAHEGTGLGLAISRRIVERMGGALKLEKSNAEGSVFAFELDLPAASFKQARPDSGQLPGLSGKRTLLIANSPFQALFISETMQGAGAAVERASGEEQGRAALYDKGPFDLVIIDCALGEEAIHRLAFAVRNSGAKKSLVLFSPFERRAFGQQSLNSFDGWLVKPVRTTSLLARIETPKTAEHDTGGEQEAALPQLPALRILIAEDNHINALVASRHLQKLGCETQRARDGHEALEMLGRAMAGLAPAFDAALLDIRMPSIDGAEVARRIRARERVEGRAPLRLVALTANAFPEDRQACLDAGIDEFLTKPVDIARLAEALVPQPPLAKSA